MTTKWLSIESAPKDGTYILAIAKGYFSAGKPFQPAIVHWDGDFGWQELDNWSEINDWKLTHWLPIPLNPILLDEV